MSGRNVVNFLLVIGFIMIIYFSVNSTQHGDRVEWIKEHGTVVNRRNNPEEYCIKCHTEKQGQTKENFCNTCHRQYNVKEIS